MTIALHHVKYVEEDIIRVTIYFCRAQLNLDQYLIVLCHRICKEFQFQLSCGSIAPLIKRGPSILNLNLKYRVQSLDRTRSDKPTQIGPLY
jgi:hypothetical protein